MNKEGHFYLILLYDRTFTPFVREIILVKLKSRKFEHRFHKRCKLQNSKP